MITLLYVKPSQSGATYTLGVLADDGDGLYKIPSRLYHELGEPLRGRELAEAELDEIKKADERWRATKKALSLLSYSDSSERVIKMKLRRAGYSAEVAEETARDMVRRGYIDEHRQLLRLVEQEANVSLAGPAKLLLKLSSKGYRPEDVRLALRELIEGGEIDLAENAERLVRKKLGDDPDDGERRALLYKNGYRGI